MPVAKRLRSRTRGGSSSGKNSSSSSNSNNNNNNHDNNIQIEFKPLQSSSSSSHNRSSSSSRGFGDNEVERGLAKSMASVSLLEDDVETMIQVSMECKAVSLRYAQPSDARQLFELHCPFTQEMALWEDSQIVSHLSVSVTEELLRSEPKTVLMLFQQLERKEEALGFIYLYPETVGRKKILYLAEMYVRPDVRGIGHAELLLAAALTRGRKCHGSDRCHLYVCDRNVKAVQLYRKFGFETDTQSQSGDKVHNLVMSVDSILNSSSKFCAILTDRLRRDECRSRRRNNSYNNNYNNMAFFSSSSSTSSSSSSTSASHSCSFLSPAPTTTTTATRRTTRGAAASTTSGKNIKILLEEEEEKTPPTTCKNQKGIKKHRIPKYKKINYDDDGDDVMIDDDDDNEEEEEEEASEVDLEEEDDSEDEDIEDIEAEDGYQPPTTRSNSRRILLSTSTTATTKTTSKRPNHTRVVTRSSSSMPNSRTKRICLHKLRDLPPVTSSPPLTRAKKQLRSIR